MASISLTTPKSILVKLVDAFQQGIAVRNAQEASEINKEPQLEETKEITPKPLPKSRLNISVDDLKTISTALLHYKRSLARMGEMERAEGVAKIDNKFYDLILALDRTVESSAIPSTAA